MYLHEEVLLLALKEESGKLDAKSGNFRTVMAGAILTELMLSERVTIDSGRRKLITLIDGGSHENAVLNEALKLLASAKRRRNIQHWIGKLAMLKGLKEKVATALCNQGVLKEEEGRFLFVFNTTRYPESNPEPERQLILRLEQAIFGEEDEIDVRTALLISLTNPSGMLSIPFGRKELRKRKKRIKEITNGELIGKATGEAIAAMQAAITVAAIMPAITAASSGSAGSPGC